MFNYFQDVNPDWKEENFNINKRKDPEAKSKKLYEDLVKQLLHEKKLPSGKIIRIEKSAYLLNEDQYYETRILIIRGDKLLYRIGLGSDYIGPSINWAMKINDITKEDIINFIQISRTIGGHIFFPRWIKDYTTGKFHSGLSINNAKGGVKGFYDRFDLLLFDLELWYSGKKCKLKDVYDKNKIWLNEFKNFSGYIEFFKLEDFTNSDKTLIKALLSYDEETNTFNYLNNNIASIPCEKDSYLKYVNGCNLIISLRNNKLQLYITH